MDFKKLECFIALYEEKNFSRAAEKMFMAQSSFSSQIKTLEEELNRTLVNRENRRDVQFTKEGDLFYDYSLKTINEYYEIQKQLRNLSLNPIKNIGLFYSSRLDNWTRKISLYNEKSPSNRFGIIFSYGKEKSNQICNGDVFIALSIRNPKLEQLGFHFVHSYYDYEALGVPYSHPLAEKDKLTAEDLKNITIHCIHPNRTKADTEIINTLITKYGLKQSNFNFLNKIGELHFTIKTNNSIIMMPTDLLPENCKIIPLTFDSCFKIEYGWYYKEMDENVKWVLENL